MLKIRINTGFWQRTLTNTVLVHEFCPNVNCVDAGVELHYPLTFEAVTCPTCDAVLNGHLLSKNKPDRIKYHLEGKL